MLAGRPSYAPAEVERGRLLLVLGRTEEALRALEKGAAGLPNDAEAQSALGIALLSTGRTADALGRLARAAEVDAQTPERHVAAHGGRDRR